VDVLCPLQVRAQWGQHIPWRDKRWIATEIVPHARSGLRADRREVRSRIITLAMTRQGRATSSACSSARATSDRQTIRPARLNESSDTSARKEEGFVRVITMWEKPVNGISDPTDENPAGGRLLVVAPGAAESALGFAAAVQNGVRGPDSPRGLHRHPRPGVRTTMLERAVPLQKRLNRIEAHIAQHTNLCTDPILFVHEAAGIDDDEFVAKPGLHITHGYNGPGQPAYFLAPPQLSPDVWRHKNDVREQLFVILSMTGNQSQAPTSDASGELVEQLRTNADRPLTPLTMNMAIAEAEVAEDVLAILPSIYTEEKLIAVAGEDNVVRTVKITPEMLEGSINIRPNLESAAIESKDRKRQRLIQLYEMGAFGNVQDPAQQPKAVKQLLDMLNFPDLNRAARPGGIDRVMAEHNVGRLVRGDAAIDIPLLKVYDYDVHIDVVTNEMKSPEFVEQYSHEVQAEFDQFLTLLMDAQEAQRMEMLTRALPVAQAEAAAKGAVVSTAALATGPTGPGAPAGSAGASSPPTPAATDGRAA
jgi:hypothetical protein